MADSPFANWLLYGKNTPILDALTNDSNFQAVQNVALVVTLGATTIATGGALAQAAPGILVGLGASATSTSAAITAGAPLAAGAAGVLATNPGVQEEVEELGALAPEVENTLASVAVNQRFAGMVSEVNQLVAENLAKYAQFYLSEGEYEAALEAPARAYGTILERAVADAVAEDPDLAPNLQYLGGANNPDFVGQGELEGFLFDITTELGEPGHYLRFYGENLIIHTYTRPGSLGF